MSSLIRGLSLLTFFACLPSGASAQTMRNLFEFDGKDDVSKWQIVNDGVMGGRSSSQAKFAQTDSGEGAMQFTGNLSLENNGGFASVRSRPTGAGSLGLNAGETIVLRLKADGRRYTFNLYSPNRRTAFSYQMDFETIADKWVEVRMPVDKFVAHSFGRPIRDMRLDPKEINSVGILLGDKNPGGFEITIDWIKVE